MCYPHSTLAGVIAGSLSMVLNQPKAGGYLFCCEFFYIFIFLSFFRFQNFQKPQTGNYNKIERTTQQWV
jgi:hypothetical protein